MNCPEAGVWRAWLDHARPDLRPDFGDHLADCPACRDLVAGLRREADLVATALAALAPTALPDSAATELARQRVRRVLAGVPTTTPREPAALIPAALIPAAPSSAAPIPAAPIPAALMPAAPSSAASIPTAPTSAAPSPAAVARFPDLRQEKHPMSLGRLIQTRWRIAAGGLAAALLLTLAAGTPQGRTATAQFLAQFRSQRFAVVTIDPTQRERGFAQLERLGTFTSGLPGRSRDQATRTVPSLAEASRLAGFPAKQPDPAALPAGFDATPRIQLLTGGEYRFTFDREKARAYFESTGHPEVSLPDKFNGATLVIGVPTAVLLRYNGTDRAPGLVIGQAGELTAGVEGPVTFEELRDFLLGLPGLAPETVRQLKAIEDWRNTLPIPVPADQIKWQPATIAGTQGLILADNSGLGSAAIWQRDGRVYGVSGLLRPAEIQRVADSLH